MFNVKAPGGVVRWVDNDWKGGIGVPENLVWGDNAFASIENAVIVASDGDEIRVMPGIYDNTIENFPITVDNAVTIRSVEGPENTIIRGISAQNVINITVNNVTIRGFTVTGGNVGIYPYSSYDNIINNIIIHNAGYGIYLRGNNNTLDNNWIENDNWGIYFYLLSNYNVLTNNTVTSNRVSGIYVNGSNENLFYNTISNNNENGIYENGTAMINYNNIVGNTRYGVVNTDYDVDATRNWWGTTVKSAILAMLNGGGIKSYPWLDAPYPGGNPVVENTLPAPFDLLSPANGAEFYNNMPNLTWGASSDNSNENDSGLSYYEVWLDGRNVENVSANCYTIFPADTGAHSWYVFAVDFAGNRRQSNSTFSFTILDSGPISEVPENALLLSKDWKIQSLYLVSENGAVISTSGFSPSGWYPTSVPTTVLSALVRNGVYPNPYFATNNMKIPDWSDNFNTTNNLLQYSHIPGVNPWKYPYWFRTEFLIPADYAGKEIWLNFNGINYRADVWLNGHKLADGGDPLPDAQNVWPKYDNITLENQENMVGMFRRFVFNITDYANVGGSNYLAVLIYITDNPDDPAPAQLTVFGSHQRNCGRTGTIGRDVTMFCTTGWDWIPEIHDRDMGIWQDVYVNATGPVDIRDPMVVVDLGLVGDNYPLDHRNMWKFPDNKLPPLDTSKAGLTVRVELLNASGSTVIGVLKGVISPQENSENKITFQKGVTIAPGFENVLFSPDNYPQLIISNPLLWWPNGYGPQNLYDLSVSFEISGVGPDNVSDNDGATFGINRVAFPPYIGAFEREYVCNGQRIFVRGGNWVIDMMLNWNTWRYEQEILMEEDANINMLRVWGGSATPPKVFYDFADKYGILIWADFWESGDTNRYAPFNSDPQENILVPNLIDTVKRLRNHASLALWCDGNEQRMLPVFENIIENRILPLYDNNTHPWIRASDELEVGIHGHGPYTNQSTLSGYFTHARIQGFNTECGVAACPPESSLYKFLSKLGINWRPGYFPLYSPDWAYHDACNMNGNYSDFDNVRLRRLYGTPISVSDYALKAQLVDAEAYRAFFEAFNRNLWVRSSGVLLWKNNSAWPSVFWQLFDWYLLQNATFYYSESALEPLHVQMNFDNMSVSVINNLLIDENGITASAKVYDFGLTLKWENSMTVDMPANSARFTGMIVPSTSPQPYFVKLELRAPDNTLLSSNFYWHSTASPENYRPLFENLPKVSLEVSVVSAELESGDKFVARLRVRNPSDNLAFFINAQILRGDSWDEVLPTYWSSNYFSLFPGENREVTATFAKEDLYGKDLVVRVSGVNVLSQVLTIHWTGTAPSITLENLYKVSLKKDLQLWAGKKLVVKFYKYDNTPQAESVIDNFVPPVTILENENVPRPVGTPVEIVRLVLTTDNTADEISTIASWTVTKSVLAARYLKVKSEYVKPGADKSALAAEYLKIKSQYVKAP